MSDAGDGRGWCAGDIKQYFEDLGIVDTEEQVTDIMCHFESTKRDNYLVGESGSKGEVELRVKELNNGKAADKDKVIEENVKSEG